MANITADRRDARESLKEDGALVSLTWTPLVESYAPDAPIPQPVVVKAWGVQLDYPSSAIGKQPDSLVQVGDKQILLAALVEDGDTVLAEPPTECECIAPDGRTYVVKHVKALAPSGDPIMYDLHVRRG